MFFHEIFYSQLEEYRGTRGYIDQVIFKFEYYDGIKADIFSLVDILLNIVTHKEVIYDKKVWL